MKNQKTVFYFSLLVLGVLNQAVECMIQTNSESTQSFIQERSVKGLRQISDDPKSHETIALTGIPYTLSVLANGVVRCLAWEQGNLIMKSEKSPCSLFVFNTIRNNFCNLPVYVLTVHGSDQKVIIKTSRGDWSTCYLLLDGNEHDDTLRLIFTDPYGTMTVSIESLDDRCSINNSVDSNSSNHTKWVLKPAYDLTQLTPHLDVNIDYQLLKIPRGDSLNANRNQNCYDAISLAALYKLHTKKSSRLSIFKEPVNGTFLGFFDGMDYARAFDIEVFENCFVEIAGIKGFYLCEKKDPITTARDLQILKDNNVVFPDSSVRLGTGVKLEKAIQQIKSFRQTDTNGINPNAVRIQAPLGEDATPLPLGKIEIYLKKTAAVSENDNIGMLRLADLFQKDSKVFVDKFNVAKNGDTISVRLESTLISLAERVHDSSANAKKGLERVAQGVENGAKSLGVGLADHGKSIERATQSATANLHEAVKTLSGDIRFTAEILVHAVEKVSGDFRYAVETLERISKNISNDAKTMKEALSLLGVHIENSSKNIAETLETASRNTQDSAQDLSKGMKEASTSFKEAFMILQTSLNTNTPVMSNAILEASKEFKEGMSKLEKINVKANVKAKTGCVIV